MSFGGFCRLSRPHTEQSIYSHYRKRANVAVQAVAAVPDINLFAAGNFPSVSTVPLGGQPLITDTCAGACPCLSRPLGGKLN